MIDVGIFYNEFDGYGNTLVTSFDVMQFETQEEVWAYIQCKMDEPSPDDNGFFTFRIHNNRPKWVEPKCTCIRPDTVEVPPEYRYSNGWGGRP